MAGKDMLGNTFASLSCAMDSVAIGRHIDLDSIAFSLATRPPRRHPFGNDTIDRDVPIRVMAASAANQAMTPSTANTNSQKPSASRSEASRCLTSSYCNRRRQHWWKVCWIYNGNHLLDSARAKYTTLQRARCPSNGSKQEQEQQDAPGHASSTLPRHFRLSSLPEGNVHYLSSPKREAKSDQSRTEPSSCRSNLSSGTCNKATMPKSSLTESKSMTTLETKQQSLFSLPRQMRFVDKISLHKEMARFCNQQLNPTQLLQHKIAQPITLWSKSKGECNKNDIVDLLNQLKGANWRHQQLQYQMPYHDAQLFRQPTAESRFIRNKQRKALVKSELFLAHHPNETCHKCKQAIHMNVASVKISPFEWLGSQASNGKHVSSPADANSGHHYYHIDCFTCFECEEILVDLKAYLHPLLSVENPKTAKCSPANVGLEYNLFCARHWAEILKPRCPYCDHLILDEECTEAEGKAWHIGHFCCSECKRSLGGQQYIMANAEKKDSPSGNTNKQLPYCLTCFDILWAELCEACGELIGCEVGAIIHEGRSWHATDTCFRCSLCLKSLLGKPFLPALDGCIYCSLTCSQAMVSHQKEKLRRQNKLHTLHSQKNSSLLSKPSEAVMEESTVTEKANCTVGKEDTVPGRSTIKENRDQFLKSMTLSRYEQKMKSSQRDYEKLKELNLSQLVNYEQFIKQNNQFFTSKYDWRKEQEFVEVVSPIKLNREMDSSMTTATLSDDHNSEDSNLAQQLLSKCELTQSDCSNSIELEPPCPVARSLEKDRLAPSLSRPTPSYGVALPLATVHLSPSSQPSDMRLPLGGSSFHCTSAHGNLALPSTYYFAEKTSSLHSPSSSNETVPSWAISPPPEYSKLDVDFKDENSSLSSNSQNIQKDSIPPSRSSGILKTRIKPLNGILNRQTTYEQPSRDLSPVIKCHSESPSIRSTDSPNAYYPSTPVNGSGKGLEECLQRTVPCTPDSAAKSAAKSVSFDPNIREKDETQRRYIRRIQSHYESRPEHEDGSDSHSCSSCSTCSSSSSDDEDGFDLDLASLNGHQGRLNSGRSESRPNFENSSNDACIIS